VDAVKGEEVVEDDEENEQAEAGDGSGGGGDAHAVARRMRRLWASGRRRVRHEAKIRTANQVMPRSGMERETAGSRGPMETRRWRASMAAM